MTEIDWLILALMALMALFGYSRGFIVGALSVGGFIGGAFLGTRLAPLLLPRGSASPYAPALGLIGALLAGAMLASGLQGLGQHVRRLMRIPGLGVIDGMLGALLSMVLGLGIVWILGAVLMQAPGALSLRSSLQRSAIIKALDSLLPPSGPILDALARLDPLPHISGPSTLGLAAPQPALLNSAAVRGAAHSVVRVLGTACGLAIEGSGWVAQVGLVVTNAHVVAGESDTVVEVGGEGPELPATIVGFDARNDLALLRVPALRQPALFISSRTAAETPGVILGYPEDGPFAATPGRIGETQQVLTQDAFGEGSVNRLLTPVRGLVRSGNSGGPMVNSSGEVLTTIFASTTGAGPSGGYGVANATVRAMVEGDQAPVGQTRCDSG